MTRKEMKAIAEKDFQENLTNQQHNVVMVIDNNEDNDKLVVLRLHFVDHADAMEEAYKRIDAHMLKGLPHIVYINGKILGSYDTISLKFEGGK